MYGAPDSDLFISFEDVADGEPHSETFLDHQVEVHHEQFGGVDTDHGVQVAAGEAEGVRLLLGDLEEVLGRNAARDAVTDLADGSICRNEHMPE